MTDTTPGAGQTFVVPADAYDRLIASDALGRPTGPFALEARAWFARGVVTD